MSEPTDPRGHEDTARIRVAAGVPETAYVNGWLATHSAWSGGRRPNLQRAGARSGDSIDADALPLQTPPGAAAVVTGCAASG